MSSRTRSHCPGCGNQYPPRARTCNLCGRTRDQISDTEIAAQLAPPQPVAPAAMKLQPPAFHAAPAAPMPQAAPKPKTNWPFVVGGVAFFLLLIRIATLPATPKPTPPPAPVAYVPSAQEKAAAAKQATDDAKFWAAKEKKEQGEVAAFNESQQPLADVRAEQVVQAAPEQSGLRYTSEQNQPNGPRFDTSSSRKHHRTSSGKRSHYSPKWGR